MFLIIFINRYRNCSEASKQALVETQRIHLSDAQAARDHMNSEKEKCKAICQHLGNIGSRPEVKPEFAHYGFDFAQQVFKLPLENSIQYTLSLVTMIQCYVTLCQT